MQSIMRLVNILFSSMLTRIHSKFYLHVTLTVYCGQQTHAICDFELISLPVLTCIHTACKSVCSATVLLLTDRVAAMIFVRDSVTPFLVLYRNATRFFHCRERNL
jgi:hypothetical protein